MNRYVLVLMLGMLLLLGCSPGQPAEDVAQRAAATGTQKEPTEEIMKADGDNFAEVISVQVSGSEGAYQFSVQVSSPDTGCDQYADWWEVVTDQGELVYRRVLLHSHVGEQPFTRSGGPVAIDADSVVWLRAHMNTVGYGGQALKGSVQNGFEPAELSPDFATDLAEQPPLPEGCAF
jgi:hypothetical protein